MSNSRSVRSELRIAGKVVFAIVCLAICWLAGYPYLNGNLPLQAVASSFAALLLFWSLNRFQTRKQNVNRLEQFLWLLEYLGSRLSSGHTLENSLINAAGTLETQMGSHRELYRALDRLRKNLNSRLDMDRSLHQFSDQFQCPTAEKTLYLLSCLRFYGGQIDVFISRSRQMLQEQIAVQKEIEAEHSQKYSEAAVLSVLPFCLSYLLILGNRQYSEVLAFVNWAIPIQLAIFILAVIAAVMAIHIMSPDFETDINTGRKAIRKVRKHSDKVIETDPDNTKLYRLAAFIKPYYIHLLPWSLGIRFTRQLSYLYPLRSDGWISYLEDKIKLGIYGLASGLALMLIKTNLWFLLPAFIALPILYQDRLLFEKSQLHKSQERLQFPAWLNTLSLLLGSGLTLQRSLELSLSVWFQHKRKLATGEKLKYGQTADQVSNDPFITDLNSLDQQLESGLPAARALNILSERCSVSQIQSALQLIIRYDSDGGNELLQLVQMQSSACWQVQKNALRKKLEKRGLLLHLPMGLDLMAVLATAILPAIASLQISY